LTTDDKRSLIHEYSHHLGNGILDNYICKIRKGKNKQSQKNISRFGLYLRSDYFAERFTYALGNELGRDFEYDTESLEYRRQNDLLGMNPDFYRFKEYIQDPVDEGIEDLFELENFPTGVALTHLVILIP